MRDLATCTIILYPPGERGFRSLSDSARTPVNLILRIRYLHRQSRDRYRSEAHWGVQGRADHCFTAAALFNLLAGGILDVADVLQASVPHTTLAV
ncbi:hypothetical protein BDW22DRAFT_1363536 [Trametopsis cervina]|nr:hypothetical protein BDW22DRAFT_1363536 [Trametopsis cervina]